MDQIDKNTKDLGIHTQTYESIEQFKSKTLDKKKQVKNEENQEYKENTEKEFKNSQEETRKSKIRQEADNFAKLYSIPVPPKLEPKLSYPESNLSEEIYESNGTNQGSPFPPPPPPQLNLSSSSPESNTLSFVPPLPPPPPPPLGPTSSNNYNIIDAKSITSIMFSKQQHQQIDSDISSERSSTFQAKHQQQVVYSVNDHLSQMLDGENNNFMETVYVNPTENDLNIKQASVLY